MIGNELPHCRASQQDVNEWRTGICAEFKLHGYQSDMSLNHKRAIFQWYHNCCKHWEEDMTDP